MPENVAILVIHGIGQQAPYETLDQFTQGLLSSFQTAGANCTLLPHLDTTDLSIWSSPMSLLSGAD
jgi:hypothetical protein